MLVRALVLAMMVCCGAVGAASAQESKDPAVESAVDPGALAAARRLIVAARLEQTMFDFADQLFPMIIEREARDSGISPEGQQQILTIISQEMRADPGPLVELLAATYARRLSAEDINAITDFYLSPSGQRLLEAQPDLMRDGARVGETWGRDILGPRVVRRFEELRNAAHGPT